MNPEIKHFLFKFLELIIISPLFGYGLLICFEYLEKAWKENNRFKKWLAITTLVLFLSIALGGLR